MDTTSRGREKRDGSISSQYARTAATLRLQMARDEQHRREMGQRIKELRRAHGYRQQYIADKVGVELRTYQFWQRGDTEPNQEHLEKLAKLFHVSPTFILRGETPNALASRKSQLDQIERLVREIHGLLTGDEEIIAAISALPDRLEEAVESPPRQSRGRSSTGKEARQRKNA